MADGADQGLSKEAWRGLAIMVIGVGVALMIVLWHPLMVGLGAQRHEPMFTVTAEDWTALLSLVGICISAFVAWKSYQAARASADVARANFEGERAWMLLDKIGVQGRILRGAGSQVSYYVVIQAEWKNFGRRPATSVEPELSVEANLNGEVLWRKGVEPIAKGLRNVASNEPISFEFQLDGDVARQIMCSQAKIFVHADVGYCDAQNKDLILQEHIPLQAVFLGFAVEKAASHQAFHATLFNAHNRSPIAVR